MGHLDRHDLCNTGLRLGLGFPATTAVATVVVKKPCSSKRGFQPSLTLGLYGGAGDSHDDDNSYNKKVCVNKDFSLGLYGGAGGSHDEDDSYNQKVCVNKDFSCELSPQSAVSNSMSNASVKREEEVDIERVICSRVSDPEDDLDGVNARKKLRLTKDQSALLEESFKLHSTLNPKQKQALAKELSLKPRQVEVWFQNRRARTKLKQTEVDCEFLKKCCETLTDENRRLQKELQELKSLKLAQPFYMQLPAATLTMCPSCERVGGGGSGGGGGGGPISGDNSTRTQFSMAHPKPHHFYNPFTNPSAAC